MRIIVYIWGLFMLAGCSSINNITPIDMLPTHIREGVRPATTDAPLNTNIAHQQINQHTSRATQERIKEDLRAYMSSIEGMTTGPTTVSIPGAMGVFTAEPHSPDTEWVHLHPDGSLHIELPSEERVDIIYQYGRGEVHPRNPLTVLLYEPRNEQELNIVKNILEAVYREMHR